MRLSEISKPKVDPQFYQTREEAIAWLKANKLIYDGQRDAIPLDRDLQFHGAKDIDFQPYHNMHNKVPELKVRFAMCVGSFTIDNCDLTTLNGAPPFVGGKFSAKNNKLKNLIGGPKMVKGDYRVDYNELVSLEGAPEKADGDFDCGHNKLISLEHVPSEIGQYLHCAYNSINFKGVHELFDSCYGIVLDSKQLEKGGTLDLLKIKGITQIWIFGDDIKADDELNALFAKCLEDRSNKTRLELQSVVLDRGWED
jgi:hypothetical protein